MVSFVSFGIVRRQFTVWYKCMQSIINQSISHFLMLALMLLLAACGGGATGAGQPTLGPLVRGTPGPAPTQPAPPTSAPAQPSIAIPTKQAPTQASATDILITYHKSGGIAGINQTLTVYADGKLELQDKTRSASGQADPADVQKLRDRLASPEFAALQPSQP